MAPATRDIGDGGAPSTGDNRDENEACEAEIVTPAAPTRGAGSFLTRRQAARRLGLSMSTVRRMEGGELHPIVDERGVRYFEATEIQAVFVRVRRTRKLDSERADGALAAAAFALFQAGADVVAVVKELREAPERIEALFDHWKRLRCTILLDADSQRALANHLNAVALPDENAILSAVVELKRALKLQCVLCEREPAYFCRSCAQEVGRAGLRESEARKLF
jgi:hypothetical protein